jgi:hypothetical protein
MNFEEYFTSMLNYSFNYLQTMEHFDNTMAIIHERKEKRKTSDLFFFGSAYL